MSENQGRGPFHLKYKPIRVCVRSESKKIVYVAKPESQHKGRVTEAFNLSDDPEEFDNLSKDAQFIGRCEELIEVAKNRVKEILR